MIDKIKENQGCPDIDWLLRNKINNLPPTGLTTVILIYKINELIDEVNGMKHHPQEEILKL